MTTTKSPSVIDPLITFWWRKVPLAVGKVSRTLSLALIEGLYIVAWPTLAAFAPLGILIFGFLAGWLRFGAEEVFTQSAIVLVSAITVGLISGHFGAMFVIGYSLADFIIYTHPGSLYNNFSTQVLMRIALLITYFALMILAVGIPFIVRLIRAQIPISPDAGDFRVLVDVVLGGLTSAGLVFLYFQAMPMLVRPLFIWQGSVPPVEAITPLQNLAWIFALIALIVAVLRILAEYAVASNAPKVVDEYARAVEVARKPALGQHLSPFIKVIVQTSLSTLLLAGLLDTWISTVLLIVGLLLIGAGRMILAERVQLWSRTMERIPVLLRLLVALGLALLLSLFLLDNRLTGISFQPLVWALLISTFCMAIVFPEPAR